MSERLKLRSEIDLFEGTPQFLTKTNPLAAPSSFALPFLPYPLLIPVKVIIFDFDGTIADTFDTILNIANVLAKEFSYKPASLEEVKRLQNLSSREIIRQSNIPLTKLPILLRRLEIELRQEIKNVQPIPGMQNALITLKQQGNQLGIVTSNSEENVKLFLAERNLEHLFDFIYSGSSLFGKARVIRRILKQRKIDPKTVFYVGDETRDIEAARKTAIKVISVSWGFNSSLVLEKLKPDFLIHHPSELATVVNCS